MTKTKHTLRWLLSFMLLTLYTAFLMTADSQRTGWTAHAQDARGIERQARQPVSLPGGIFRILKPWVAKQCVVVNKRTVRCVTFPWLLGFPGFAHIS